MKNIMLLFLSRLSLRGNLIGTKPIYDLGQGNLVETHTTNESAVRYLLNHLPAGEKLDRLYIFASQNVQGKPRQIDEPGFEGEYNDLAYFIQRLVQFWPEAKESIQVENYNENLQGQEAIGQIMDMSRDIQAYGQQQGDIRLHADLTGGFRSANMAMLNIIKLLQYSGMDIGYLLYSHMNTARDAQGNLLPSYVEDAHIIYSMLDLVSGAAEFVRFGSVDSIMEYYGSVTDKSPALEELLEAMDNFAKEIKLCHYGTFKESIYQLQQALDNFAREKQETDMLLEPLLYRIHKEYDAILDHADDDIALMEWCLQRDYLQQAMILYTERIVPLLADNHVLILTAAGEERLKRDREKAGRKELNADLIYDVFVDNIDKETSSARNKLKNKLLFELKLLLKNIHKESHDSVYYGQFLEEVVQKNYGQKFGLILQDISQLAERLAAYDHLVHAMLKGQSENDNQLENSWLEYYLLHEPQWAADRVPFVQCSKSETRYHGYLKKYYGSTIKNGDLEKFLQISVGIQSRLESMIESGELLCKLPLENILAIYNNYCQIRDERNISSHAKKKKSQLGFGAIKSKIQTGLNSIKEAIAQSEQIH